MALIIEDGSLVENANSWVSRADFIAYAASKGITVADEDATDAMLVNAGQFINSKEPQLKGRLVTRDQAMSFPRYDLCIEEWSWWHTEIPRQVILAQMELALDINAGVDLYNPPANPNLIAKRERVEGAVEVEYFGNDSAVKVGRSSQSQALLAVLMRYSGMIMVRRALHG
tara:strand:+ start:9979 stop:10491 length:513 start_codon:yes stop_codon:yes gene_type:complete